jgi:hypothetical protein
MAFTFNGFGTKFYGEGDRRPDGSFVTTEWITAAYIPVFPLRSFRSARLAAGVNVVVFQSKSYAVLEKLPIHWPQVGRIYLFVACTGMWWAVMGWLFLAKLAVFDRSDAAVFMFPFIAVMALPFGAVWWLRRRAYRVRRISVAEPPPLDQRSPVTHSAQPERPSQPEK